MSRTVSDHDEEITPTESNHATALGMEWYHYGEAGIHGDWHGPCVASHRTPADLYRVTDWDNLEGEPREGTCPWIAEKRTGVAGAWEPCGTRSYGKRSLAVAALYREVHGGV